MCRFSGLSLSQHFHSSTEEKKCFLLSGVPVRGKCCSLCFFVLSIKKKNNVVFPPKIAHVIQEYKRFKLHINASNKNVLNADTAFYSMEVE